MWCRVDLRRVMSFPVMSCDTRCIPAISCHFRLCHLTPGVFKQCHVIAGYVMWHGVFLLCHVIAGRVMQRRVYSRCVMSLPVMSWDARWICNVSCHCWFCHFQELRVTRHLESQNRTLLGVWAYSDSVSHSMAEKKNGPYKAQEPFSKSHSFFCKKREKKYLIYWIESSELFCTYRDLWWLFLITL